MNERNETNKTKIIERVKKLLALAEDNGAADGEIENAMNAANELIRRYQIEKIELEAASPEKEEEYGADFVEVSSRRMRWMGWLAIAVSIAVGSVQVYGESRKVPKGAFGKAETVAGLVFYGPTVDVELAKEVFEEWLGVITTIATGRYGSPFTGNGNAYALGFAGALQKIAKALYDAPVYSGTKAIVPVTRELAKKRAKGNAFLASRGVKLTAGKKTTVNFESDGRRQAYRNGADDAKNSGFGVSRTKAFGGGL